MIENLPNLFSVHFLVRQIFSLYLSSFIKTTHRPTARLAVPPPWTDGQTDRNPNRTEHTRAPAEFARTAIDSPLIYIYHHLHQRIDHPQSANMTQSGGSVSSLGQSGQSHFYDEWQSASRQLSQRMETWMKSTNSARDEAERARSRAEADRNAAQEARDQALKQLVTESGGRIAAQERLHEAEKERDEARSEYISMQRELSRVKKDMEEAKQALLSERESLNISEVERKATRKDLDNAMKELVQIRRENERLSNSVAHANRQLEETKSALAASREEIKVQASKAREFEKRANTMIDEAKKSVNQLRSSTLLQEGLRTKAEIGMSEAAKEMAAAQDAAAAVAVERKLLQDRMESLIQERDSLHDEVEKLGMQLERTQLSQRNKVADSQEFLEIKGENKRLSAAMQRLEQDLGASKELVAELNEEVANCRESEEIMRQAMEEAALAKQTMRKQWNEAEDALYESSQARASAEEAKRKMTEALVRERSSRIMAQQNLERLQAQKSDIIPVDVLADVDKARLALWHEEMAAEHKSLELILEAVKELSADSK